MKFCFFESCKEPNSFESPLYFNITVGISKAGSVLPNFNNKLFFGSINYRNPWICTDIMLIRPQHHFAKQLSISNSKNEKKGQHILRGCTSSLLTFWKFKMITHNLSRYSLLRLSVYNWCVIQWMKNDMGDSDWLSLLQPGLTLHPPLPLAAANPDPAHERLRPAERPQLEPERPRLEPERPPFERRLHQERPERPSTNEGQRW